MCKQRTRDQATLAAYLFSFLAFSATAVLAQTATAKTSEPASPLLQYARIPLHFEENVGQTDAQVRFLSRGTGYGLFLTPTAAVLALSARESVPKGPHLQEFVGPDKNRRPAVVKRSVLRLAFQGTRPASTIAGIDELEGKANYFIGNDATKWHTNIPLFSKVQYSQIYQGIDVVYYGSEGRLEYDLVLAPKADPRVIRFRTEGAKNIKLTKSGDLQFDTSTGTVVLRKPKIYQADEHGKKEVKGGYVIRSNNEIGVAIAAYDKTKQLTVDPVLEYSTYLGGSGQDQIGSHGGAVDAQGNSYITGCTTSPNFPATTTLGIATTDGSMVVFVSKINASGAGLIYSTYLSGGNNTSLDVAGAIAVDVNGYAYVTGETTSASFPVTSTAYQSAPAQAGQEAVFMSKLSADGQSLLYSSYFGGTGQPWAAAIAVDGNQAAYIGGAISTAATFPTTANAFQTTNQASNGNAFVSKIETTLSGNSSLAYSTFIGGSTGNGSNGEGLYGLAVESSGKVSVVGYTLSNNYPVTATAYQSTSKAQYRMATSFLSQIDTTKSGAASLLYSTYFGGSAATNSDEVGDEGDDVTLDPTGKVYISGFTMSPDFPITLGSSPVSGVDQAFVAKFDLTKSNAASLVYSTVFGTGSAGQIAVDTLGNAYVAGSTNGTIPLTADAVQSTLKSANGSGYLTIFSSDASTIIYGTYFGSSGGAYVGGLALDIDNNIYLVGGSSGIDLPTTEQLFQPTLQGSGSVNTFLAKFGGISTPTITSLSANSGSAGTSVIISGLNFGSSQGTVTFGAVGALPSTWSSNSITVPVPAGAITGSVVVTAGGVPSNPMSFAVLAGTIPIVLVQHARKPAGTTTSVPLAFASNNTAGNWLAVCISASGVSQALSVSDANGNLYRQAFSINETGGGNTLAVFYAENIAGGPNVVTVSDPTPSNLDLDILEYSGVALFSSLDTTVSAMGNSSSPNSGTTITTANGDLLLGAIMSAAAETFTAGSGYTEEELVPLEPATILISEDQTLPQAGNAAATATLSASGYWAAGLVAFKTANGIAGTAPIITGLSPVTGTNGTVVTISGYNFGASQGTVQFNGTTASPSSWSPTAITVADPTGATAGNVVVTVNGVPSNGVWFPQPKINSLSSNSGAIGSTLTINGANFGATTGAVRFNGIASTPSSWIASRIVVPVPSDAETGPIVVANSQGVVSNEVTFAITGGVPTVISLSPGTGATGTAVTIKGTNFGSTQGTSTVSFNGVLAGTATQWVGNTIKIAVPSGADTGNVVVTVGGLPDLQTNIFTVPGTPSVLGISPSRGGVGAAVSIAGSNFGSSGTVKFAGVTATPWSWSPTLIVVPVPSGASSGTVEVTVGGTQFSAGIFSVRSSIPSTATEFSYDALGRVIQKTVCTPMNCGTEETPLNLSVTYDLAGDETSVSFYGPTIQYTIDGAARVTQVTSSWNDSQHPPTLATVNPTDGYWPTGQLRAVALGNGLTESTVYNDRVQPCRINVNSSGTLLSTCADALPAGNFQDFNNGFNARTADNGNVASFTAAGQQNFSRSYTYDTLNRLQAMSAPGDQCSGLSWTIDPWGNRTAQTTTGGYCFSPSTAVNTANQLTGSPYQYDLAGDLLNDGNHQYAYDAEGRVISVDAGATASYVYDAFGQRVQKNVGGLNSEYVYDQNKQLNTVFGDGSAQRTFVYIDGHPLAEYFDNTTYFIHTDHLGSTRILTELNQSVLETDDYYPYGELIPPTGGTGDIQKFTGKERDTESGLDNFGARYNASSMGRFMSPDPSNWGAINESPQTWNAYSYVANNPLNATDPDGLDCVYTSGQSSSSVTVTVVRGDCLSDKDNGVYVNGTVDVNSLTYNGRTGDLGFSYTNPEEGSTGVGIDALGKPSNNSGQLNPYAQAVFSQRSLQTAAATMNDPRTYALWFGASATLGYGLYAAGAFEAGGALTTLSGENGLDLIGNRAINQMIGDGQRELLKEFFETGKAPEGLTDKSLQLYKEVAQRAIAAGKDQLGVQAQRLQMITSALK